MIIVLAMVGVLTMTDNTNKLSVPPEPTPIPSELAISDAGLEAKFHSSASSLVPQDWRLVKKLLTRSQEFGPIWRADYDIKGIKSEGRVNRIICWINNEKVAVSILVDQDIPPLVDQK